MKLEEFKKKLQSKKEQLIITIEDPNSLKKIKYSISNFSDAISLVSSPLISILILIYVPFGFFHMNLGIRTILEDYLDSHKRGGYLILNNVVCCFLAIAVILSIIKINLYI